MPQAGIDEAMARRLAHHRQHARIAHAAGANLLLHHVAAGGGVGVGSGAGLGAVYFSRCHASRSTSARSSVRSRRIGVTEIRPSLTAWKSVPAWLSHTGSSPPIQ